MEESFNRPADGAKQTHRGPHDGKKSVKEQIARPEGSIPGVVNGVRKQRVPNNAKCGQAKEDDEHTTVNRDGPDPCSPPTGGLAGFGAYRGLRSLFFVSGQSTGCQQQDDGREPHNDPLPQHHDAGIGFAIEKDQPIKKAHRREPDEHPSAHNQPYLQPWFQ